MWADCYSGIPGNSSMELSINDSYKLAGTSKEGFLTNAEVLNSLAVGTSGVYKLLVNLPSR